MVKCLCCPVARLGQRQVRQRVVGDDPRTAQKGGEKSGKSRRCVVQATEKHQRSGSPPEEKLPGCPGGCLPAVCFLLSSGRWSCCLVPLSGPLVGSGRLALSSGFVLRARIFLFLKRGDDPGHRPKDPSFGGTTTQGPIFSQVPTSTHGMTVVIGRGCWVLTLVFTSSFGRLPYLRSSVQTHRWGAGGRTSRVEQALRGSGSSFLSFSRGAHVLVTGCVCRTRPSIFCCVVQANDLQHC